jgi:hypothetical protein
MKLHHRFAGALLVGSLVATPTALLAADQLQTRDRLRAQDGAMTPQTDRAQKRNRARWRRKVLHQKRQRHIQQSQRPNPWSAAGN